MSTLTMDDTSADRASSLRDWHVRSYDPTSDRITIGNWQSAFNAEEDTSHITMLISEVVLNRDWNSPEEDEAWADL